MCKSESMKIYELRYIVFYHHVKSFPYYNHGQKNDKLSKQMNVCTCLLFEVDQYAIFMRLFASDNTNYM